MTWSQYLAKLKSKTPQLQDGDASMKLTVRSFLRQLQLAYEAGRREVLDQVPEPPEFLQNLFGGPQR